MSAFTTPLDVEFIDGTNWRVLVEFDFASETLERIVRVPVGFLTDFASVPRILWNLWPPCGRYGKAAVIHDLLYRDVKQKVTRLQADHTLLEGMRALQVDRLTCWIIFLGVRLGGKFAFHASCRRPPLWGDHHAPDPPESQDGQDQDDADDELRDIN